MESIFRATVKTEFGSAAEKLYRVGDTIFVTPCEEDYLIGYYWLHVNPEHVKNSYEAVSSNLIEVPQEFKKSA